MFRIICLYMPPPETRAAKRKGTAFLETQKASPDRGGFHIGANLEKKCYLCTSIKLHVRLQSRTYVITQNIKDN
jgi:hypothetical protein